MKIFKFNPFTQPELVQKIALVYKETFGGAPWNEGYKCPVCAVNLPLQVEEKICPFCLQEGKSIHLVNYWPVDQILSDFYQEMSRPESICLAVEVGSAIVGFAWGYQIVLNQETEEYLGSSGLCEKFKDQVFFYLDDVGIKPDTQCKGFGRKIIEQIFAQQKEKNILLRTMEVSQMFHLIKKMGGEKIYSISGSNKIIMML